MRGLKIQKPETLFSLADQNKSMTYFNSGGILVRLPAAFIIGMPFKTVMELIRKGLYVYEKDDD